MPFLPDAIRMPWNRAPAKAAPSTTMLYPKSDNGWYSRDAAGVETLVGGPPLGTAVTFTPTWTSTGTAPAIGNGTLTGQYTQIGKFVSFKWELTAGTTTTFGTGVYRWALPVTAAAHSPSSGLGGYVYVEDAGLASHSCFARIVSTTTFELITTAGALVSATSPFTFGNTDFIRGYVIYQAA